MAESAEHSFVSSILNDVLMKFSPLKLYGVVEADRRTFDYACILHRDFSRPLVSQVLWKHAKGIDKDIRTLINDQSSLIKVYFVRDTTDHRIRLEEILTSYKSNPITQKLLSGLKIIYVPGDFDADREAQCQWMKNYLENVATNDLLFNVVFGKLNAYEFKVFNLHGGPIGLKYAILHEITENGLFHMPTFKSNLGYKTDGPIREAITMLSATGLIQKVGFSNVHIPTLKGRLLLDLTKRILFEAEFYDDWSQELKTLLYYLGQNSLSKYDPSSNPKDYINDLFLTNIFSAQYCAKGWGRDLLNSFSSKFEPNLYSEFKWEKFAEQVDEKAIEDEETRLLIHLAKI